MRILTWLIIVAVAQFCGLQASASGSLDILKRPMTVTIVRGGGSKCEPLCPQWIAAEGQITAETPALLQKALDELGDTKLPVLLDSLGGDLDAAIAMGTMIHQREMAVAIAATGYLNCDPRTRHCFKGGKPEGIYRGFPVYAGYCSSTCILVLAGGKERIAGGAMSVMSDHPSSFDPKKSPEKIIAKVEKYLSATMGNFVVLELMKKAAENEPYLFSREIMQEASIVTSDDWAETLVDRKLCFGAFPARNCVPAE
jgi:hypothetical protein